MRPGASGEPTGERTAAWPTRWVELLVLQGTEFTELDEVGVATIGTRTAAAITRGRHLKRYLYLDANEDALVVAEGPSGRLIAVMDGHSGADAALAVARTVEAAAHGLVCTNEVPTALLEELTRQAIAAVAEALDIQDELRAASATTLVLVLAQPDGLLWHLAYGDSDAALVRAGQLRPLGERSDFLRTNSEPVEPVPLPCRDGDWLIDNTANRAGGDAEDADAILDVEATTFDDNSVAGFDDGMGGTAGGNGGAIRNGGGARQRHRRLRGHQYGHRGWRVVDQRSGGRSP